MDGLATIKQILVSFFQGKRVFVTGHTGFKGSWLSLCLKAQGAEVFGYALDPQASPNLFEQADVAQALSNDCRADILDIEALQSALLAANPDLVIHLAAQALVRESYQAPLHTMAVNVMGTAHLLEACRHCPQLQAILIITTDKVYQNTERQRPYSEDDALGGHDPYSASKACAELVSQSYRMSFFNSGLPVATARAGNVIGGGDWGQDRLLPDCMRAFAQAKSVYLRYPKAIRPWQHVLEPVSGYLKLLRKLASKKGSAFQGAWNFGPQRASETSVHDIADQAAVLWGDQARINIRTSNEEMPESQLLRIDSTKAMTQLGWRPRWSLDQTLRHTISWYRAAHDGADMKAISHDQINAFGLDMA